MSTHTDCQYRGVWSITHGQNINLVSKQFYCFLSEGWRRLSVKKRKDILATRFYISLLDVQQIARWHLLQKNTAWCVTIFLVHGQQVPLGFANPDSYTPINPANYGQTLDSEHPLGYTNAVLPHPPNTDLPNPVIYLKDIGNTYIDFRVSN